MRLDHNLPTRIPVSEIEDMYDAGFKLLNPGITELLSKAFNQEELGFHDNAQKLYRKVNYHFALLHYVALIKLYVDRLKASGKPFVKADIISKFNLNCVQKGLICLCMNKYLDELMEIFGVGFVLGDSPDEEDCVGIGKMIVGYQLNDRIANIVGDICAIPAIPPPYGEFSLGEFERDDFFEVFQ